MFTLIKHSTIKCSSLAPNQCKAHGHDSYDYRVELKTNSKLDDFGFVIDHAIIHQSVLTVFTESMGSCEELAYRCAQAVNFVCYLHNVKPVSIEVTIKPTDGTAYVIYHANLTKIMTWNAIPRPSTI